MLTRSYGSLKDRKDRVGKLQKLPRKSFHEIIKQKLVQTFEHSRTAAQPAIPIPTPPQLSSTIITAAVGRQFRLFAAHEDILSVSPYFATACKGQFLISGNNERQLSLPDEEPEVFSCILEYLYKGDYSPRLVQDKRNGAWMLEGQGETSPHIGGCEVAAAILPTIYHSGTDTVILRDTAVYCAADKYGLDELKRIALKKQGLQCGIEVSVILRSARYAYDHTPETDSRLRAHYLALIIRSRRTFKRSGTMQMEMEMGGKLFFDLFVAMCNHMDDIGQLNIKGTPKTI